jgi:hypothetical protein
VTDYLTRAADIQERLVQSAEVYAAVTAERADLAGEMLDAGWTYREVAGAFGISIAMVQKLVDR